MSKCCENLTSFSKKPQHTMTNFYMKLKLSHRDQLLQSFTIKTVN